MTQNLPEFPPDPGLKKLINWMIILSVVLILLGTIAIFMPLFASAVFTLMMGWLALISGVVMIVQSFVSKPVRGFWLNLVVGIFYAIAGVYILFNLASAVLGLTLAFGILFIVEGVYTIVMAFTNRAGHRLSWLVALNGVITLILGIMVLNRFPFSALWLVGLYVGISLLFSGVSLLAAALATRKTIGQNTSIETTV